MNNLKRRTRFNFQLSDPPITPTEVPSNPVTPEPANHPIESPPSENPIPVREPPTVNPPVASSWSLLPSH